MLTVAKVYISYQKCELDYPVFCLTYKVQVSWDRR